MSGVHLDTVDKHFVHVLAVDLELDDGVRMSRTADVLELVEVQRDGDRIQPVTEDDRRNAATPAQLRDVLADLGPAGSCKY